MRLPRELDPVEIRVLGCLLEKKRLTPDAYPLSVNALVAACNQKSNRDPVMDLTASDVEGALSRLRNEVMTWPEEGARVTRWSHNLDRTWALSDETAAVMTMLLLRGPQTVGELRARTERMVTFDGTAAVERTLIALAGGDEPLAVQLPRQPGQKEVRWTHLAGGAPDLEVLPPAATAAAHRGPTLAERVAELEARVARLEELLPG